MHVSHSSKDYLGWHTHIAKIRRGWPSTITLRLSYLLSKGLTLLGSFLIRRLQRMCTMCQQLRDAFGVHLALIGVQVAQDGVIQSCSQVRTLSNKLKICIVSTTRS